MTVASAPGEAEPTVDQLVKMVEGGDATLSGSKEKKDDEAETYTEADEINQEELQMIKARTMYEMVEDLSDGKGKLLFLTNPQADLIASSPSSLQKMLDALEIPKPSLVITLLRSGGFAEFTRCFSETMMKSARTDFGWAAGCMHGRAPFASVEEEEEAETQLDMFMADILIPLAAQTNAIVLCDAIPCECILTRSFTRMYAVARARWGTTAPFTVLSTGERVKNLYHNPKPLGKCYWHEVRRSSKTWRQRDAKLAANYNPPAKLPQWLTYREHDLDPNARTFILVDSLTTTVSARGLKKVETYDTSSYSNLMTELVRYLSSTLPSLALKTGFTNKDNLSSPLSACLKYAADVAQSGTPVLFLDVRRRPIIHDNMMRREKQRQLREAAQSDAAGNGDEEGDVETGEEPPPPVVARSSRDSSSDRAFPVNERAMPINERSALIQCAMRFYERDCKKLLQNGVAETLDVCSIAYFHDVLYGDGNTHTTEAAWNGGMKHTEQEATPLYLAIRRARDGTDGVGDKDGVLGKPTPDQIAMVARWLTERYFSDAWELITDVPSLDPTQKGEDGRPKRLKVRPISEADDTELHKSYPYHTLSDGAVTWSERMFAMRTTTRQLLSSPNLYHLNLVDKEGARRLVNQLVRLDRLPTSTNLEGLQLLRHAWRDYDVAVLLATRYKRVCKVLFAFQLVLGWLIVCGTTLPPFIDSLMGYSPPAGEQNSTRAAIIAELAAGGYTVTESVAGGALDGGSYPVALELVFALTVTGTLLVSFDGLLHSKSRWRALRSAVGNLEGIIWCYRTRVAEFEMDESRRDSNRPEAALCEALRSWRDELVAGASLATSNLEKEYHAATYRHCQDTGELPKANPAGREGSASQQAVGLVSRCMRCVWGLMPFAAQRAVVWTTDTTDEFNLQPEDSIPDDFHSPVQPQRYIRLRMAPALAFYKKRLPAYTRRVMVLRMSVLLLGVAASVLAKQAAGTPLLNPLVTVVSAFAVAITAWVEFSDGERKVERYTRAARALKNLLAWWDSLGEVEKASKESIWHLIGTSESIIGEERLGWFSTRQKLVPSNAVQADHSSGGSSDAEGSAPFGSASRSLTSRAVAPV